MELGVVVHDLEGSDRDKLSTLQSLVTDDHKVAVRYRTSREISMREYSGIKRLGRDLGIFEHIFLEINAPREPLVVITVVKNNELQTAAAISLGPLTRNSLIGTSLEDNQAAVDYLDAYISNEGFDIPKLLDDDYFSAIKLLFNNKHFVSCAKLIVSFIDTVAFVDNGDLRDECSFQLWLDAYADLTTLDVTSKELWEFRNGLLHMTSLSSRSVLSGKVSRLVPYTGYPVIPRPPSRQGEKYLHLNSLIEVLANATAEWIKSYNSELGKLAHFVSRYDLVISDARARKIDKVI